MGRVRELKAPLAYNVGGMIAIDNLSTCEPGDIGQVISDGKENVFVNPADERNLSSYLSSAQWKIVGRGVLVEQIWADNWVVAWRSYDAKPEVVPYTEA